MIKSNLSNEKFREAIVYTAAQDNIQKGIFRRALRRAGKTGLVTAAGIVSIGAIDYFFIQSGATQSVLDSIISNYDRLTQIDPDSNLPLILSKDYRHWLLTASILLFGFYSLGAWGINSFSSKAYNRRNDMVQAVLRVPHDNRESEYDRYNSLTGKTQKAWERDLHDYFRVVAEWGRIENRTLAIRDDNLQIGTRVPEGVYQQKTYLRPDLEDIILGLNQREDREKMLIPESRGTKVAFSLPLQINQPQMYFEGRVFDDLAYAKDFLGLEIVCKQLSSEQWVIGSCGPEKSRSFLFGKRKRLAAAIQDEILYPFYYSTPSDDDLSIALVLEATYPVERGGVATLISAMMRDLKPEYFNGRELHYEVISILGFTGPYKTRISYEFPRNAHMNPPIIVFGHTMNPSLDIIQDLTENRTLFPLLRGENKSNQRSRELKQTIFDLEDAIASFDFKGFYNVADRIKYFSADEILFSAETLEALHDIYHQPHDKDKPSFERFQYQWRDLRQPLVYIIKSKKAHANIYYSLLTGVGGVYSALAKREFNAGLVLTEHGIYREDRLVDIANSGMDPFFARKWGQAFDFYSRLVYDAADSITTLCESNRAKQIRDGAPEHKTKIIRVGISLDRPKPSIESPGLYDPKSFTVGMLGNVQPVKQVELFISAAEYLSQKYKSINWQFHVMGRDDPHAKSYAVQIHKRVEQNDELQKIFHFSPYTNYVDAFTPLDVGVLTSSSEVLPVSIIEFISLGKLMIAMDVGGISELINGVDINGNKIDDYGPAGLLVGVNTPENVSKDVADAILTMYLRKCYLLTGKRSDIPEPTPGKLDYLLRQRIPIEEAGPKRIKASFYSDVVLPLYAQEFMRSMQRGAA